MAVLVQQKAPSFTAEAVMEDGSFKQITLEDYRGKYVLLFFYPLDFTFVCPTEIISFSDRGAEFQKLGVQILGVSVDSAFSHLAWRNTPRTEGGQADDGSWRRFPEGGWIRGGWHAGAIRHRLEAYATETTG